MKIVPVVLHLTVHTLSFHIKFPATLSLQLEIGKHRREIISNMQLSNKVLQINREVRQQIQMLYSNGQFEQKEMNIVILLTTKTNLNKLTAGIVHVPLNQPTRSITHLTATPTRCNDQNAYIEYSLRADVDLTAARPNRLMHSQGLPQPSRGRSEPHRFSSAVVYNNREMNNLQEEEQYQNQLQKYLNDSQISRGSKGEDGRNKSKRKHQSSSKYINNQSWVDDQSKTERRSYSPHRSGQINVLKQSQDLMAEELRRQGEKFQIEVDTARKEAERLLGQNKELRGKVKRLEEQLQSCQAVVKNMHKKIEMKEGSAGEEVKQLRGKLQQTEVEVHELMKEKSLLLGNMQSKEKQWLTAGKEKEKIVNEQRKRILSQLQQKQSNLTALKREADRLKQDLTVSESMVLQLNQTKTKLQDKLQAYDLQMNKYKIEFAKAKQDLRQLEEDLKSKGDIGADVKALKKQILELQKQKDDIQLKAKHKDIDLDQSRQQLQSLKSEVNDKTQSLTIISKQLQTVKKQLQGLRARQRELIGKVNRYESDINKQHSQSDKISKHVKQVEFQLNKIKLQSDYSNASKVKKLSEYQRINQLLNNKIQLFAQQNFALSANIMQVTQKYKIKQQQNFYLGQQLIVAKQSLLSLQAQTERLRQENDYLVKQTKILDQRQEELSLLHDKLQYNQKMLEEMEQGYQLRQIELTNQIKLATARKEQREEQLQDAKQHITKLERQGLELQGKVQSLTYSLRNKENELQYLKGEVQQERKSKVQFEERMTILQRTEDTSLSSIEQLREENLVFKRVVAENQQAINALGRRYDGLYKSMIESLGWFLEILKSGKKLVNQSIRNDRVQISSLLNDSIREVAEERRIKDQELEAVRKEMREQTDKNRESDKILKIKGQIQEELQREISILKNNQELQQVKLSNCENQILDYQKQLQEKTNSIRQLDLKLQNLKKQMRDQIASRQQIINTKTTDIQRLKDSNALQCERWKDLQLQLHKKIQNNQIQAINKLTASAAKYSDLQTNWRAERELVRGMKLKNNQLENTIARQIKQREVVQAEVENRAKDLINAKVQLNFKSKIITEKQTEINEQRKVIDRLERQKEGLQNRRKGLQQGNKTLVINRGQLEEALRQKNSQITANRMQITVLQESTAKLIRQKQQLLKQKKTQVQHSAKLNDMIKTLKEGNIRSDEAINKLTLQKQSLQKEFGKRINVLNNEKQGIQRQFRQLKSKQSEGETQQAEKYAALANQLRETQLINQDYSKTTALLRAEIAGYVSKMNHLSGQKIDMQKLQQFLDFVNDLKILGGNSQKNRTKLKKISSNDKLQKLPSLLLLSDVNQEIIVGLNRLKIKILNRSDISQECKSFMLEDVKHLQLVVEKLGKCAAQ